MEFTYDLNTDGLLIIQADRQDKKFIKQVQQEYGEGTLMSEIEALDPSLSNSDLDWIQPEEIGALTSAPILGLRDEHGNPIAAWAFMDYQVRSFLTDLLKTGKAVFTS